MVIHLELIQLSGLLHLSQFVQFFLRLLSLEGLLEPLCIATELPEIRASAATTPI